MGQYFYSKTCCLECHLEGKDWKPKNLREKIGKYSGPQGEKRDYNW